MCLIIAQPDGDPTVSDDILENGWSHNPDGAGYMLAVDGKLIIRKPFYKLKHLKRAYKADHAAHGQTSAFVIHFRYSTHGDDSTGNVHPHPLADGSVGLVHNGIMPFEPPYKSELSDTAYFCRTVLAARPADQLMSESFGLMLADMIGASNKLVLMDTSGSVHIINSKSGQWDGGRWYSGSDWKSPPMPKWRPSALPTKYMPMDLLTPYSTDDADDLAWWEACEAIAKSA